MRLTKSLAKDIAKILSKSFAGDAGKTAANWPRTTSGIPSGWTAHLD